VDPVYIPETRRLPDLLKDFQRSGQHMAVVLDEFGGLSGVITLEDALELLVGEIEDEFDQEQIAVVRAENGGWSVPGHLSIRRLEVLLNRAIDRPSEVDSVGGLSAHVMTDGVEPGTTAEWDRLRLRVEEVEDGRASRIHVTRIPRPPRE
jgi:CBS domain containing-hemolysin-like protein